MYTEVRELVNFVCRYLFGRIPRRPTGIFAAELANFLVVQFSTSWDVNNPQNGELERMIFVNCGLEGTSKCLASCAREAGLNPDEVNDLFPHHIRFYANPGSVYMRALDGGMNLPIWNGEITADDMYQPIPEHVVRSASNRAEAISNLGGVAKPVLFGKKKVACNDQAVNELVNSMFVPLGLERNDQINSNLSHYEEKVPYLFTFKPSSSQTYTGVEFSQTRFGSSKSRPDLQTMLNIKQLTSTVSHHATSCTSFSSPKSESMSYSHY